MENEAKFSPTIILIDAVTLNDIIRDFKRHFEQLLQRPIEDLNLPQLIVNLTLDSAAPSGENETQVALIYDQSISKIKGCSPSDLKKELHQVAFKDDRYGEYIFASLSSEEMTPRDDFFLELLQTVGESPDVKRIIIAPSHQIDYLVLWDVAGKIKDKKIILFSLLEPKGISGCTWQTYGYPIIQALGITGDEL